MEKIRVLIHLHDNRQREASMWRIPRVGDHLFWDPADPDDDESDDYRKITDVCWRVSEAGEEQVQIWVLGPREGAP